MKFFSTMLIFTFLTQFSCSVEPNKDDMRLGDEELSSAITEKNSEDLELITRPTTKTSDGKFLTKDDDHPYKRFFAKDAFTSTWDGRLYWTPVPLARDNENNQWVYKHELRYFRSERLAKKNGKIVTDDPDLLSAPKVIYHGHCPKTSVEKCRISQKSPDARIPHASGLNYGLHVAAYPTPGHDVNPHPSNAKGDFTVNGGYKTYHITQVYAVLDFSDSISKKRFGQTSSKVIIDNRNPKNATIASISSNSDGAILKIGHGSHKGQPLRGYEGTTSLDGRLLIFNSDASNKGVTGYISYSFNPTPSNPNNWTSPKNITELYSHLGPGRSGGEYKVMGTPFSQLYPLAKNPLKDSYGIDFGKSTKLTGAYPWLSYDGSELFMTTISLFKMATRTGYSAIGARTNWAVEHLDGGLDYSRGKTFNVSNDVGFIWDDCNLNAASATVNLARARGCEMAKDYKNLYASKIKYVNREGKLVSTSQLPNNTQKNLYQTILTTPIGLFGSQWNPFASSKPQDVPLPVTPGSDTYVVTTNSTGKLAEIEMGRFSSGDYVVSWAMNEAIDFDKEAMNERHENLSMGGNQANTLRARKAVFNTNKTPDRSGNFHVGTLNSRAQFPFEFYNASSEYEFCNNAKDCSSFDNGELNDFYKGARGNSIYFKPGGFVSSTLGRSSLLPIRDSKRFSISFWLKPNPKDTFLNKGINILSLGSGLILSLSNQQAWLFTKNGSNEWVNNGPALTKNISNFRSKRTDGWMHFAFSFHGSSVDGFINGVHQGRKKLSSTNFYKIFGNNLTFKLGHLNGTNGYDSESFSFQLDEFDLLNTKINRNKLSSLAFAKDIASKVATGNKLANFKNLGRDLFFDPVLSANHSTSCASCHNPNHAFANTRMVGKGIFGLKGTRNTPTSLNRSMSSSQGYDGNFAELEDQVLHPINRVHEMGLDLPKLIDRLEQSTYYTEQFEIAFGNQTIDNNRIRRVLSTYVHSLATSNYAKLFKDSKPGNSAKRGKELFFTKARCAMCHNGPNLTNEKFMNIGSATEADKGKFLVTREPSHTGRFKVPSLINLQHTAPYFHDGQFKTLSEVINFYDEGKRSANTHPDIKPLNLTDGQKTDLVNFLNRLSDRKLNELDLKTPLNVTSFIKGGARNKDISFTVDKVPSSAYRIEIQHSDGRVIETLGQAKISLSSTNQIRVDIEKTKSHQAYKNSGIRLRLVVDGRNSADWRSRWFYAQIGKNLNQLVTPKIVNAGPGCNDKKCFWVKVDKLSDHFMVILAHPNSGEVFDVFESSSLSLKKNPDGSKTISKRINKQRTLNNFKAKTGIAIYIANYNYAQYKGRSASAPKVIKSPKMSN